MSSISVFAIPKTFTNLSVPSVIFADAVWYGSLRGGVELGGGHDGKFSTTGSRWGIKGSSEVSEGLTAKYLFETRVGSGTMSQDTNQLYVGLSGGFGTLMLGKFHNAAYLAGGIRDIGNWYSGGDVNTKAGNTLSYGYAADAFALQVDAIMDGGTDTGKAVDEAQFGLAVNLGDIGKVAIGYEKVENTMASEVVTKGMPAMSAKINIPASTTPVAAAMSRDVMEITVTVAANNDHVDGEGADRMLADTLNTDGSVAASAAGQIRKMNGKYMIGAPGSCNAKDAKATDACIELKALVYRTEASENVTSNGGAVEPVLPTETYYLLSDDRYEAAKKATPDVMGDVDQMDGYKRTGISASFGLGGTTVGLGYSSKDSNDPMHKMKEKTTYFGVNGSIGDTGMDWRAWGRKVEDHAGMESSPWGAGVGKALGGGAYAWLEHSNKDKGEDGTTHIALNVNF